MIAKQWQILADKFMQLSLRERVMIVSASTLLMAYLLFSLVLEPSYKMSKQLQSQVLSTQQEKNLLMIDNLNLQGQLAKDPNEDVLQRIARAELALETSDDELSLFTSDLITSKEMAKVLRDVLAEADKVKLLTISSLPVQTLQSDVNEVIESKGKFQIYKHGLRVTMRGQYFDVLNYLRIVEQLPKKFYWEVFDYKTADYPNAEVVMEFYTLSLNEEFIRG